MSTSEQSATRRGGPVRNSALSALRPLRSRYDVLFRCYGMSNDDAGYIEQRLKANLMHILIEDGIAEPGPWWYASPGISRRKATLRPRPAGTPRSPTVSEAHGVRPRRASLRTSGHAGICAGGRLATTVPTKTKGQLHLEKHFGVRRVIPIDRPVIVNVARLHLERGRRPAVRARHILI